MEDMNRTEPDFAMAISTVEDIGRKEQFERCRLKVCPLPQEHLWIDKGS
jgi:hypothetical protein